MAIRCPRHPEPARSVRRRSISERKANENQVCALAGKLLLESDSSNSCADASNIKEQLASIKDPVKEEDYNTDKSIDDKGICDQIFFVPELVSQAPTLHNFSKETLRAQGGACSGPASVLTTSDCSVKVDSPDQLIGDQSKVVLGGLTKIENAEVSEFKDPACYVLGSENKTPIKTEHLNDGNLSGTSMMVNMCNSGCPVTGNTNTLAPVSSDYCVKIPISKDNVSCGSFPVDREDVKLGIRDDDGNSGCIQPSTGNKPFNGDRKVSKLMASDCWKESPTLNDVEKSNADVEDLRDACCNRKNGYESQRSLRDYPFKKRKLYDYSLVSDAEGGRNVDESCGSPGKGSSGDASAFVGTFLGATGPSSSSAVECTSLRTTESKVKIKIKSFRVPELFIELPETATVGSLKRTVFEAVTAILGGGLHVGVLLQGKKIRDDNNTLLQTGISHDNKPDGLVFTLEPHSSQALVHLSSEGHSFLLHRDKPQPLTRYPSTPNQNAVQQRTPDASPDATGTNFNNFVESDRDSASSPPDMSQKKSAADSRALVAVPSMNAEPLNAVPMQTPKRSESAQCRIRRPFSVLEVETLVQAVEKLGTGRWRDVKLRAFDTAKHRTYVDLKDKWKTLVHTARISPQQRRGEPVPQALLDRVLTAHAHWSQPQEAEQHHTLEASVG